VVLEEDDASTCRRRKRYRSSFRNARRPGDSGRVQCSQALVRSLAREDAAGKQFGVTTATAEAHADDAEWDAQFDRVLA